MTTTGVVPRLELDNRLTFLSQLLFNPTLRKRSLEDLPEPANALLAASLGREDFDAAVALADSNHVTMRTLPVFRSLLADGESEAAEWIEEALERETARIARALTFLRAICDALDSEGCNVVVIKSLDHWPDLGSDLDLYTNATPDKVIRIMRERFQAQVAARSWGDRLANKWNFLLPGLPELVEIHMGRLGQTGEQVVLSKSLVADSRTLRVGDYSFRVPSAEHRVMISTLQRMYRHFYIRLCDIADNVDLVCQKVIRYDDLRSASLAGGIWPGVATYLSLVSEYVQSYDCEALDLPPMVAQAKRFGAERVSFRRGFLRIPILPHSARLYRTELASFLRRGDLKNAARLCLLPGLATAAALVMRITGSDKGIW